MSFARTTQESTASPVGLLHAIKKPDLVVWTNTCDPVKMAAPYIACCIVCVHHTTIMDEQVSTCFFFPNYILSLYTDPWGVLPGFSFSGLTYQIAAHISLPILSYTWTLGWACMCSAMGRGEKAAARFLYQRLLSPRTNGPGSSNPTSRSIICQGRVRRPTYTLDAQLVGPTFI